MSIVNVNFEQKAKAFKRDLIHKKVYPKSLVAIESDQTAYQGLKAVKVSDANFPHTLKNGESIILDFGDHYVGHINFSLSHLLDGRITDSPCMLRFTFAELPIELIENPQEYSGDLGCGWLQYETKSVVFTPYTGALERRYAFRYLKIERIDSGSYDVALSDIYADCTSAVEKSAATKAPCDDALLQKIYDISVNTLKECEQDVFEDGPKRDRRLWIGDLRLQALTDFGVFKNTDLIKRCIYLFAAYILDNGRVASCIFPDSPPYTDPDGFLDYSLFFVSCLYDYEKAVGDLEFVKELFPVAREQIKKVTETIDFKTGQADGSVFIDWCPDLEKEVAFLGVYIYVLKQFIKLCEKLGEDTDYAAENLEKAKSALLRFYSEEDGLFKTKSGQISLHSQIWAVLSGVMAAEDSIKLLEKAKNTKTVYTPRTPYMMHYYIEALYNCGLKEQAMDKIKTFWGEIANLGFDCFPEIFNPENHRESPYGAAEINSACHAWSCTPAYWINRYYNPAKEIDG